MMNEKNDEKSMFELLQVLFSEIKDVKGELRQARTEIQQQATAINQMRKDINELRVANAILRGLNVSAETLDYIETQDKQALHVVETAARFNSDNPFKNR